MTLKDPRDALRVAAMIESAEEVKIDAAEGKEAFLARGRIQKAVLLDLILLTESADKASATLKKANPRIPWKRLSELRNHGLVHDYMGVNLEDIWEFVRDELPPIRRQLKRIRYPNEPAG